MARNVISGLAVLITVAAVWLTIDHFKSKHGARAPVAGANVQREEVKVAPATSVVTGPPGVVDPAPVTPADPLPAAPLEKTPDQPRVADAPPANVAPQPAKPRAKGNQNVRPAPFGPEPLVPKPLARAALGFVGADAQAEEVWAWSINDPNRSPKERQDLIEDLNEEGFPDPKNVTFDDVPLILSRLALIEEFAPDSMDQVNAAAFAEAYKDLVNMLVKLARE